MWTGLYSTLDTEHYNTLAKHYTALIATKNLLLSEVSASEMSENIKIYNKISSRYCIRFNNRCSLVLNSRCVWPVGGLPVLTQDTGTTINPAYQHLPTVTERLTQRCST